MEEKPKITFSPSLPAMAALKQLVAESGETQTSMLNQAIIAYAYLKRKRQEGALTIVQENGRQIEILFL